MPTRRDFIETVATETSRRLADEGKLIESGHALFEEYVIPKDAPDIQRREMKLAFMAGADYLFSSIMTVLDEEAEPTEDDLRKLSLIANELQTWQESIKARIQSPKGNA